MQMSSEEHKKGLRSFFLSSVKFCQPLVTFQAASMSKVMAAYAAGGSAGNSAVLEDGGAGLTSFVWSDPKVNLRKEIVTTNRNFMSLEMILLHLTIHG